MTHPSLHILKKRWKIIAVFGVLGALIAPILIWLLPIPLEYRADAQMLIIAEARYGVDPYTAAKSAEHIGENLSSIVGTSDFYNKVFAQSGPVLDQSLYQNISENKRRKRWQKNVSASVLYGTSVLHISAYHENPTEARAMAGAVAQTMLTHAREYVGGDVQMRIINQPIVSEYPVRPNMMVRAAAGAFVGVLFAFFLFIN